MAAQGSAGAVDRADAALFLRRNTEHLTRDHIGASLEIERCGCDESIALRAPQSVGIAEKIERLREDAAQRAREWRRYGHEFQAIEWDAVARWLGSVK